MRKNGRADEKVKLGTTILVKSAVAIDNFKQRYPRDYKSPGEVIDLMVDFILNVKPSIAMDLSRYCKRQSEAANRELDELGEGGASLYGAEIRGRRDYYSALAAHMERLAPSGYQGGGTPAMKRIEMRGGAYVIIPDAEDWVLVNEAAASNCENVYVVEVRNGSAFNVPRFVYFADADSCSNDEIIDAIGPVWPKIREIQDLQVVPAYDKDGRLLNAEEWKSAPIIGVFRILDSTDYGRFNEPPFGAMVYRP